MKQEEDEGTLPLKHQVRGRSVTHVAPSAVVENSVTPVIYHVLCAFPRIVDDLSYCPALHGQNRRSGRLVLEQRLVHNVPGGRKPLHRKDMAETVSVVVGRG